MSEIPDSGTPGNPIPEQLPPLGGFEDEALRARPEAAGELRSAQEAWLERRDVLKDTPHLTMTRQEFGLLRNVGLGGDTTSRLIDTTRENYGIPLDAQYAAVDIAPDDVNLPHATKLVGVGEEDFGTVIDEERLESHGIEPEGLPRITMKEREFELFRIVGIGSSSTPSLIQYARDLCGIPRDDQYAPQYALIDIAPDDPNLPNEPLLVDVTEADFGTTIDVGSDDKYFQSPGSDPDSPPTPESGDAYKIVDISDALVESWQGLQTLASELMRGITADPLSSHYGDIGVRAGGLADGQKDAYVWTTSPFTRSVELTLAFPSVYDSVCIVRGQRREAPNGKAAMAQIVDPTEVLKIEGENLRELQQVYRGLYQERDFALTEEQRRERDEVFNDYLAHRISHEASNNRVTEQARQDDENRRQQPQLRAR